MGTKKEYRKGLKYRVASARSKTLESLLSAKFRQEIGTSKVESNLLGERISKWILKRPDIRGPNQIIFCASKGRASFARRYKNTKKVNLTAYDTEDLELELEFGIYTLQISRLFRILEEAYSADSLLSAKELTLLLGISPTALRGKLQSLRSEGIFISTKGMAKKDRKRAALFRSTWVLAKYFKGFSLQEIRKKVGITKGRFRCILNSFAEVSKGHRSPKDPQERQWLKFLKIIDKDKIDKLKVSECSLKETPDWNVFKAGLATDFNFSPIKLAAIGEVVDEIISFLCCSKRGEGDIIYWAVSAGEPAGIPLKEARLIPATLTLYSQKDMLEAKTNRDLGRVSDIKLKKAARLARQAKEAGAYLSYADLSYLLGMHSGAISRLVNANPATAVPLRGRAQDIGQGITHRKKIIALYLQMHTETEIVDRTGHSYEAVENYINEFANVYVLYRKSMPPVLIRRVTGRSIRLIKAYIALIKDYCSPEYAFRFSHLEQISRMHNLKKNKG